MRDLQKGDRLWTERFGFSVIVRMISMPCWDTYHL